MSDDGPNVEVITDPQQVAAARRAYADAQEARFVRALEQPQRLPYEHYDVLHANVPRAIEGLTRLRDDETRGGSARVIAVGMLNRLGVPPAADQLARIAASDADGLFQLLAWIDALYGVGTELPDPVRRVVAAAVENPRKQVRLHAESVAARYGMTEVADVLQARAVPDGQLSPLAKLRPTEEVLALLTRFLADAPGEAAGSLVALICVAQATRDPDVRRRAIDTYLAHMASLPDRGGIADGGLTAAIQVAAAFEPKDTARQILTALVTTAGDTFVRECALNNLYPLDRATARRLSAESGLPLHGDPSDEPEPSEDEILDVLAGHGVIDRTEMPRAGATAPNVHVHPAGRALARLGRFVTFEQIAESTPYRHDLLLLDIAQQTAGRFEAEATLEDFKPTDGEGRRGEYGLQFIHAGRLYRTRPRDLNFWYDVDAVVDAANRACADAGFADQFVALQFDSPVVELVFAQPAAVAAAMGELGIELNEGSINPA